MEARKKHRRALKIAVSVLLAALALYLGFYLFYGPLRYRAFYREMTEVAAYRDTGEGFVPQGVSVLPGDGRVLVCGYMPKDKSSRIYVFEGDGKYKRLFLETTQGEVYTGHAGGLSVAGDYLYISNAHKLFTLKSKDVLEAKDGATLRFEAALPVPCNSSFCSNDGTYLYVGEYHADGYDTDESHRVEHGGETFEALVFAYPLAPDGKLTEKSAPICAFAVPDEVQGFAVKGKTAVLSRSRGFSPSSLETYDAGGVFDGTLEIDGRKLPLYVLGQARRTGALPAPHMSEDLEFDGGRLLVGFEAGARKFGVGLLPGSVKSVVALDADELMK